jgi:hypothetical protein
MKEGAAIFRGLLGAGALPSVTIAGAIASTNGVAAIFQPMTLAFAAALYPVCVIAAALFGLPFFLYFRRMGWMRWWSTTATGIGLEVLIGFILVYPALQQPIYTWFVWGAIGGVAAFVFWYCWSRRDLPDAAAKMTTP